jgi:hypothetical protein
MLTQMKVSVICQMKQQRNELRSQFQSQFNSFIVINQSTFIRQTHTFVSTDMSTLTVSENIFDIELCLSKERIFDSKRYDDENRSLYSQFEIQLKAKLMMNARCFLNETEQM